jgi:voltage-gated potassium channel
MTHAFATPRSERFARRLFRPGLTVMRAARTIALTTLVIVAAAGVVIHWVEPETFPNVWLGLWWAVQTVTSVGYGDVVPHTVAGRLVAVVVMLNGIALLTVVIAAISASFVEGARRRAEGAANVNDPILAELRRINRRLDRLEPHTTVDERRDRWQSDPFS